MRIAAILAGALLSAMQPSDVVHPFTLDARPVNAPDGPGRVLLTVDVRDSPAARLELLVLSRGAPATGLWQLERKLELLAERRVAVAGRPGRETLLVLLAGGRGGYALEGPFRWPAAARSRSVRFESRRTARGRLAGRREASAVTWVPASDEHPSDPWPVCAVLTPTTWECIGIPSRDSGVVVVRTVEGRLLSGVAHAAAFETMQDVPVRESGWGRLVRFETDRPVRGAAALRLSVVRPLVSHLRPQARFVPLQPETGAAVQAAGAAAWITGQAPADGALLECAGSGLALTRISMDGWHAGAPDLPLHLRLPPGLAIAGRVVGPRGEDAAGALVSVFELEEDTGPGEPRAPFRMHVRELAAQEEGAFEVSDLAQKPYEVIALHSRLGRVRRIVTPGEGPLTLRLAAPREVGGRVLRDGRPAAGIDVLVVPALGEVAAADDHVDYFAPGTRTDRDGRFRVPLPPFGAGELRAGSPGTPVARRALPPATGMPSFTDLGDIDLGAPVVVEVVVGELDGCTFTAAGPLGSPGLTIVAADRPEPGLRRFTFPEPGYWGLGATCGDQTVPLHPPGLDVTAAGVPPRVLVQRR